jgi:hypothetical protein
MLEKVGRCGVGLQPTHFNSLMGDIYLTPWPQAKAA